MQNRDIKQWYNNLSDVWTANYENRDRHFIKRLQNVYLLINDLSNNAQVLDIGCGTGEITFSLYQRFKCKVIGLDFSDKMISICEKYKGKGLIFRIGDITKLNFDDRTFDCILSLSVLEWIEDYEKAISEVSRVLKPEGQWIVSLPNRKSIFRKIELINEIINKNSYLKYQKNKLSLPEFKKIAEAYHLKTKTEVFHVAPFVSSNISGKIGPFLGMMCMMSLGKINTGSRK